MQGMRVAAEPPFRTSLCYRVHHDTEWQADKEQRSSNSSYKDGKAPKRVNSVGLDEFAICGYFFLNYLYRICHI